MSWVEIERFICTAEEPWHPEVKAKLTLHPDARKIPKEAGGTVEVRCPNCGHEWKRELPQ